MIVKFYKEYNVCDKKYPHLNGIVSRIMGSIRIKILEKN